MDHLIEPENSSGPLALVPYIGSLQYDHKGFWDFPFRQGYEIRDTTYEIFRKDGRTLPLDELAGLLQAWLYFGLVSHVLKVSVASADFIRPHSNPPIVDSSRLTLLICQRIGDHRKKNNKSQDAIPRSAIGAIIVALRVTNHYDGLVQDDIPQGFAELLLSVHLLATGFTTLFCYSRGHVWYSLSRRGLRDHRKLQPADRDLETIFELRRPKFRSVNGATEPGYLTTSLLWTYMVERGWCPMKVRDLLDQYSNMTVYYMALLPRHAKASQHKPNVHQNCMLQNRCLTSDGTIQDVSGSHYRVGCSCESRGPDMDHVTRIIQEGGIPLVSIKRDKGGTLVLEIVAAKAGIRYTAISHVWVDGLGNPSSNILPECWIEELKARLDVQERTRRDIDGFKTYEDMTSTLFIGFMLSISLLPSIFVLLSALLSALLSELLSALLSTFLAALLIALLIAIHFAALFVLLLPMLSRRFSQILEWTMGRRKAQLQHFFSTQTETYFWLDVFCIPAPTDVTNVALKTRAIQRMVPTYVGATSVLVFDKEWLQSRIFKPRDVETGISLVGGGRTPGIMTLANMRALILASTWNTRCWTLQEASVAKQLWFQWKDRCLPLDGNALSNVLVTLGYKPDVDPFEPYSGKVESYWSDCQESELNRELKGVDGLNSTGRWLLFPSQSRESLQDEKFFETWNNFSGRSTTKWEDTHGILANMLDFDAGEILELPVEHRMKALVKGLGRYPTALLGIDLPCLTACEKGEMWLPRFPGGPRIPNSQKNMVASLADDGLHLGPLEECCCILVPSLPTGGASVIIRVEDARSFKVSFCRENEQIGELTKEATRLLVLFTPPSDAALDHDGKGFCATVTSMSDDTIFGFYDSPIVVTDGSAHLTETSAVIGHGSLLARGKHVA